MAWAVQGSLKGPQGEQGAEGLQGQQGIQGASGLGITFKGQVPTDADLPNGAAQGDSYIVQADDSFWVYDASTTAWVNGGSIQGPQGIEGPQGAAGTDGAAGADSTVPGPAGADGAAGVRGATWFTGSGVPAADLAGALAGDLYLDTVSGDVYTFS